MKNTKLFLKNKIYNHFMDQGKKFLSEQVLLKSFKVLQKTTFKNHKNLIKLAIINTAPAIYLKQIKKKKRKTTKEFPFTLNKKNRVTLAIKSIIHSIEKKTSSSMKLKLSNEILLNSQNKSEILKSKKNKQLQALTKKKYVFFRWFC